MRDLTLEQRKQLLRLTATSGVVANLEVALVAVGVASDSQLQSALICNACKAGHSSMACHLLRPKLIAASKPAVSESLEEAAAAGLRAVWEALQHDYALHLWFPEYVIAALRGGHLELAEWLLERVLAKGPLGDGMWARLLQAAAISCDLPALESLRQRCGNKPLTCAFIDGHTAGTRILSAAAGSCTPDWQAKVEWAESKLYASLIISTGPDACAAAVACPDTEQRLAWLMGRGYHADGKAVNAAVRAGKVAALQLLLAHGLRPGASAVAAAAGKGWLDALKELRQHGVQLDADAVAREAAGCGHLPVLAWAVEELGASLQDVGLVHYAAERCNLGTLEWLHQHGCSLAARQVVRGAAQRSDMATLRWAVAELGAASLHDETLMNAAARSGRVELMAWLRERGCPWVATTLKSAAGTGCEAALEWLVEQGCPMPADGGPYTVAASNGDLATLRCLARLGCPWGPARGSGAVFEFTLSTINHSPEPLPVLRLLVELGCPVDWEAPGTHAVRAWLRAEAVKWRQQ
ncbi:hypothetical protein GPECTOR_81g188 [Gonium pectorale]|uniref:Ankyrin repeat domain-containing protein n=1 Tax=Gonium pectorale TaxID=33097 RepID=A0A150G348_GONPE|nr:hypothetical protein GPECTOR_81g188 [Gonium pectorale]|eukprot:KXZ43740.1 hypothetical protein GPECTOR_81g188 [Gonium pectorale]